ncbi:hypothetical protein D3C75_811870 [compost metagenome]
MGAGAISRRRRSSLSRSMMSLKMLPRVTALRWMVLSCCCRLASRGVSISMRLSPTMPLSGVRSSWLMVEMKVVLSRLAFSSLS